MRDRSISSLQAEGKCIMRDRLKYGETFDQVQDAIPEIAQEVTPWLPYELRAVVDEDIELVMRAPEGKKFVSEKASPVELIRQNVYEWLRDFLYEELYYMRLDAEEAGMA